MSPGALPWGEGVWCSSWYVVSIDTGHRAQSPQPGPRWSPAFKMKPVLSVSSFNARDSDMIPELGRCPGEGNGNPLQYSFLENSTDSGD